MIKLDDIVETRVVTSHLPVELAKKLEEERRQLTLEALADVKAGRTHDHAEIDAWAGSLPDAKCAAC